MNVMKASQMTSKSDIVICMHSILWLDYHHNMSRASLLLWVHYFSGHMLGLSLTLCTEVIVSLSCHSNILPVELPLIKDHAVSRALISETVDLSLFTDLLFLFDCQQCVSKIETAQD